VAVIGLAALLAPHPRKEPTGSAVGRPDAAESSPAPDTPSRSPVPPASPGPSAAGTSAPAGPASPPRSTAARTAGPVVSPPPTEAPLRAMTAREDVDTTMSKSASADGRQTLRVVSADGDLTGQQEMVLVGDEGTPVGSVRCTQNFRFSRDAPAETKPTMMICWWITPTRSVYALAVDRTGSAPSAATTAAVVYRVFRQRSS
jgi:hypothetical protein